MWSVRLPVANLHLQLSPPGPYDGLRLTYIINGMEFISDPSATWERLWKDIIKWDFAWRKDLLKSKLIGKLRIIFLETSMLFDKTRNSRWKNRFSSLTEEAKTLIFTYVCILVSSRQLFSYWHHISTIESWWPSLHFRMCILYCIVLYCEVTCSLTVILTVCNRPTLLSQWLQYSHGLNFQFESAAYRIKSNYYDPILYIA